MAIAVLARRASAMRVPCPLREHPTLGAREKLQMASDRDDSARLQNVTALRALSSDGHGDLTQTISARGFRRRRKRRAVLGAGAKPIPLTFLTWLSALTHLSRLISGMG